MALPLISTLTLLLPDQLVEALRLCQMNFLPDNGLNLLNAEGIVLSLYPAEEATDAIPITVLVPVLLGLSSGRLGNFLAKVHTLDFGISIMDKLVSATLSGLGSTTAGSSIKKLTFSCTQLEQDAFHTWHLPSLPSLYMWMDVGPVTLARALEDTQRFTQLRALLLELPTSELWSGEEMQTVAVETPFLEKFLLPGGTVQDGGVEAMVIGWPHLREVLVGHMEALSDINEWPDCRYSWRELTLGANHQVDMLMLSWLPLKNVEHLSFGAGLWSLELTLDPEVTASSVQKAVANLMSTPALINNMHLVIHGSFQFLKDAHIDLILRPLAQLRGSLVGISLEVAILSRNLLMALDRVLGEFVPTLDLRAEECLPEDPSFSRQASDYFFEEPHSFSGLVNLGLHVRYCSRHWFFSGDALKVLNQERALLKTVLLYTVQLEQQPRWQEAMGLKVQVEAQSPYEHSYEFMNPR